MKTDKEFIEGIYQKYEAEKNIEKDRFTQIEMKPKNHKFIPIKILGTVATFLIVFGGIFMYQMHEEDMMLAKQINNTKEQNTIPIKQADEENISLATVKNFNNFYNIMKEISENSLTYSIDGIKSTGIENSEMLEDTTASRTQATSSEEHSETNVQVQGVDEADIVKTDGKYIYYVSYKKLNIIDITKAEEMQVIVTIDYSNTGIQPSEIYINGNKLILLGNIFEQNIYSSDNTNKAILDIGYASNKTVAIIYDISNKEKPKETRRIEIDGGYLSSRMIEDNVYFVSNYYLHNIHTFVRNNIEDLKEDDYMLHYKDTNAGENEKCLAFDRIYYFEKPEESNYLSIVGLNLNNDREADIKTFLGAGRQIYSSNKNMYIIKNKEIWYEDYTRQDMDTQTKIFKFALDKGKIKFKAETEIPGRINNQFSMDENSEGYFRIATTIMNSWEVNDDTTNNLYVLDENLNMVGKLEGLAQGEKIYSVRYMSDKAYIVTFKQTDPLFVIDLSNNTEPKVLGKLKIPGYSTYLHPYDESHIIGFGYNTKTDGTRITTDGLKMAMFDVTDLSNPKEMFKIDVGGKYDYTELTYNHKALLYSKEKNIIGFPIHKNKSENPYESIAQIYNIDLENGFILAGEISHGTEYNAIIKRIIYAGNNYFTISDGMVKASNMNDFREISICEL